MRTRKTSIITFLLCIFMFCPDVEAKGGKWFKKAFGGLGKAFTGVAVGVVESKVEKYIPEEQRETWRDMNSSFASNLGVDGSYRDAGRSYAEGKTGKAIIDLGEGVANDAGVMDNALVQTAFGYARAQNEYKEDIKSGMSEKEAIERRNQKLVDASLIMYDEYLVDSITKAKISQSEFNEWVRGEKEWEGKITGEIYRELLKRGYSNSEAFMYLKIIQNDSTGLLRSLSYDIPIDKADTKEQQRADSIDYMTTRLLYDENVQSKIEEMLDNMNIRDRTLDEDYSSSNYENSFFGTPVEVPNVPNKSDVVEDKQPVISQPVVDERAKAIGFISKVVLDSYTINDVKLSDAQKSRLNQVADKLNQYENIQIIILGHTCDIGTQNVNTRIGERRAMAAKDYLMSKGIAESRIQIESRASSEPLVENDNEEHRKQNRRVTFRAK